MADAPSTPRWPDRLLLLAVALLIAAPAAVLWWRLLPAAVRGSAGAADRPDAPALRWWQKSELRSFVGDNFGGRDQAARAVNRALVEDLGVGVHPAVAVGREGWLFHRPDEMDFIQGRGADQRQLAAVAAWLRASRDHARSQGARYLVVVPPCKASIYPDRLPAWAVTARTTPFDRLLELLRGDDPVEVLDLRPALRLARAEAEAGRLPGVETVFQRYDTHWNDAGAFAGCQALAARLAQDHPAVPRLEWSQLAPARPVRGSGDLARLLGLHGDWWEDVPQLAWAAGPTTAAPPEDHLAPILLGGSGDARLPTALVMRDSFAQRMIPYLDRCFASVTWAWVQGSPYLAPLVEQVKPALVIHEFNERQLADPPFLRQAAGR